MDKGCKHNIFLKMGQKISLRRKTSMQEMQWSDDYVIQGQPINEHTYTQSNIVIQCDHCGHEMVIT